MGAANFSRLYNYKYVLQHIILDISGYNFSLKLSFPPLIDSPADVRLQVIMTYCSSLSNYALHGHTTRCNTTDFQLPSPGETT